MDDLLADFLTETNESLAELDVALVTLERTPDDAATLSLIFRMVHTIKGTCGFLGLSRLEHVAHAAENVLGKLRDGTLVATPDLISVILTAVDRIKLIVTALAETAREPKGDDGVLIAALDATAAGKEREPSPDQIAAPDDVPEEDAPDLTAADPVAPGSLVPRTEEQAAPARAQPAPGQTAAAQTIRVTVDVLEDLMTLVSELVLTRNQLLQLARSREDSAFTAPLQRLSHITSDLQEGVMKTRMQPIGNAWNKLPRLVRDLGRDLGKRIELTMLGADTELDRQVLELIKDPLTHMVRNSGDHGLETPADRRAAGKPETGRITLNAFHEGGHIIIEIADDGRGLSPDKMRAKVLANGLVTEAELAAMPEEQVQRFIFHAGFSTATQVTAVSGRGVGLDVVKTNIEKIGGTVDLKSIPGQGTTFTIKIPLTLAIVSALIVEAAKERFAIPQISVVELVRARQIAGDRDGDGSGESAIERINDTPVLRLRDRLLPLVSLTALLGLTAESGEEAGAHIVVAQVGASLLGIIVDRVFDTEEIVVKPVAPILRHITMFSGNTILGDGSVIMILDPAGIARATGVAAVGEVKPGTQGAAEAISGARRLALLLFRAGGDRMAVPLSLVARLENIPVENIERLPNVAVTQYRGKLMPLISMSPDDEAREGSQPMLVFVDGDRAMGLMVGQITDVVDDRLDIELSSVRPGSLGSALIAGQATDVLDTSHWLTQVWGDWFETRREAQGTSGRSILFVEDSAFFRNLLSPRLAAAGFRITTVPSAEDALRIRDNGQAFDAIISDIEMPGMDGLAFARHVRESGPWSHLPMIALSGLASAAQVAAGHDAGFSDYVPKSEHERVIEALRQCLATHVPA